jgi:hypothetical protein
MGRSQVQRNKTHGRPGQAGRGRGIGGAGRGSRTGKRQDLSKLGDNSYRFENKSVDVGDDYDGLLDAIHISGYVEPDDLFDETTHDQSADDYLSIDVAAMAKCLEQLPIAERLNLPGHVGKHLEEMYGGVRKKTLAELREDDKVQVDCEKKSSAAQTNNSAKANGSADEEDLEAWLDDMIS